MRISDFGFRISDYGARLVVSNPQSAIRNPQLIRRGASILEVLFAILVTTIGLLGAVAVFPVATAQARKGRIADAAATAGRSAINTIDARGMRRPTQWVAWEASANMGAGAWLAGAYPAPEGQSFCIDPRFIAYHNQTTSTAADRTNATWFPHALTTAAPRMRRITLATAPPPLNGVPMGQLQADSIFVFDDDLTVNRFASANDGTDFQYDRSANDRPAAQAFYRLDHDSDATTPMLPMKRNNDGQLSWMATFVPKLELYIPPGSSVTTDQYVLSSVIFNQRPADFSLDPNSPTSERVLGVDDVDGFGGGEATLVWPAGSTIVQSPANDETARAALKLRAGDWIMLCGNATHNNGNLMPVFRWYRVTDAQTEPEYHGTPEEHYAVQVSLTGQDWDVSLTDQRAVVVPGVVAVYEKTVRLEAF